MITFTLSFTINLKSVHPAIQFQFIFMVFARCKTCVDIPLNIFISIVVLNQNRYPTKPRNVVRLILLV
ncbi:hypothetical protein Hanom_Chr10g00888391 [Helianthus anomalus]